MAIVIRYVDNNGHIIERFLGIQHVSDTIASSLKTAIEALFSKHGLSISRLRGQGYDGTSNIRGEFNGLKALILNNNPILDVLEIIREDGMNSEQRMEAVILIGIMESFNFVFMLHCLRRILAVTNELSQALQRKDQDIENGMSLLKTSKERFKLMRENDWESLLEEVSSFCIKHDIDILNMDDEYKLRGRSSPNDSFFTFNKEKLVRLALFYPSEFSIVDFMVLGDQLDMYIIDLRGDYEFSGIEGIASLAEKMVKTKKNLIFPLVYMLIKLSLLLPVATATVERVFSAMHIVKSRLLNRMRDKWMNDSLVVYIEKDIFDKIDNEAIMKRF
ncbi:uncharacterized protein LOC133691719 [Populus nigra]|uniref:uncharacterized protein LOC133691719 n=1 Tax=Populus nigra TaxID=3691 RepID=UPI002B277756|nr:uncharacterized protein LOC133691719 [Populus nigra]